MGLSFTASHDSTVTTQTRLRIRSQSFGLRRFELGTLTRILKVLGSLIALAACLQGIYLLRLSSMYAWIATSSIIKSKPLTDKGCQLGLLAL